jgi:hypothetical protein
LPAGAGSLVAAAPATPEPATAVLFGAGLVAVCGTFFHRSQLRRTRNRSNHRHAVRRPKLEPLEERSVPAFLAPIDSAVGIAEWKNGNESDDEEAINARDSLFDSINEVLEYE